LDLVVVVGVVEHEQKVVVELVPEVGELL